MDAFVPLSKLLRPEAAWFVRQREIVPAPPERVWRAITDPSEMAQWWCERAEVDLRVGGWYAFGGRYVYGDDPGLDRAAFEITDLEDATRLEFHWPLRGFGTTVLVELSELMEETEVVVTQTAEAAPPWAPLEGSHHWWSVALPGLRAYLERGQADLRPDYPAYRAMTEPRYLVEVNTFPWMIWRKLTDPTEIKRWLSREARIQLEPGGVFELGPGPGPRHVLAVEEEKLLTFDWHEPPKPVTRVSFQIEEGEDATLVTLIDHGPHPPDEDPVDRDRRIFRWMGAILHLKGFAERGVTPREYQEG